MSATKCLKYRTGVGVSSSVDFVVLTWLIRILEWGGGQFLLMTLWFMVLLGQLLLWLQLFLNMLWWAPPFAFFWLIAADFCNFVAFSAEVRFTLGRKIDAVRYLSQWMSDSPVSPSSANGIVCVSVSFVTLGMVLSRPLHSAWLLFFLRRCLTCLGIGDYNYDFVFCYSVMDFPFLDCLRCSLNCCDCRRLRKWFIYHFGGCCEEFTYVLGGNSMNIDVDFFCCRFLWVHLCVSLSCLWSFFPLF